MPFTAAASAADWTGFYAGLNAGYSWGRTTTDFVAVGNGTVVSNSDSLNMNGVIGGGQIGFNYNVSPQFLIGIEADLQASGEKGSINRLVCSPAGACDTNTVFDNYNEKLQWFGTVRGRFGFLVSPRWLVYGTGGVAYGKLTRDDTYTNVTTGTVVNTSLSGTKTGAALGLGVETMLWGNFTGRVEYLHLSLPGLGTAQVVNGQANVTSTSNRFTDDILRFALNYRF